MNNLITYTSSTDKFVAVAVLAITFLVAAAGWLIGSYFGGVA